MSCRRSPVSGAYYTDLASAYALTASPVAHAARVARAASPVRYHAARALSPVRAVSPVSLPQGATTPVVGAGVYAAAGPLNPCSSPARGVVPAQAPSAVEESILRSVNPLPLPAAEVISADGHSGAWVNKHEAVAWRGTAPIQSYAINHDPAPAIVRKKPAETVLYNQEVAVKYLQPPKPAPHGDIVVRKEANIPTEPAPPVVIRQQPPPPATPPPVVVREAPPPPPPALPPQHISIPGQKLPPPPRKVVVEKLPALPNKPQNVIIERWLPYEPRDRRVVFQPAPPDPVITKPKNVIIEWESPNVTVRKEVKNLGVVAADPVEYVRAYGATLRAPHELPGFVREIPPPAGVILASDYRAPAVGALVGDLHALALVDLEREGLAHYRSYCTGVAAPLHVAASPLPTAIAPLAPAPAAAYYDGYGAGYATPLHYGRPLSRAGCVC